jgi:transposase
MMNQRDKKLLWLHDQKTVIAGVDIAKRKHWCRTLNLIGMEIGKGFSFENSRDGFWRLLGGLDRAMEQAGAERVVVAMEPSGHYWKPLARFLLAEGITVVLVNPMHVKRTKETDDNSPAKNDRKDAFIIADLARQGKFLNCMLPQGVYAELRVLSQGRQEQMRKRNAAVCQLRAILDEYFPEFETVFKDPLGKTAQLLLGICPFPSDLAGLSEKDLVAAMKQVATFAVRRKPMRLLLEAATNSIGVREGLQAARLRLRSILAEVQFWHTQLAQTQQAMARAVVDTGVGQYLLSIRGVGIITVAGFLGEVGDLSRYEDWRQVRKLAGLNLGDNSSGEHNGRQKITKRGRPFLRCLLYQVTLTLVAHNPQFKALYYFFKSRQANPLKKKQALVAVACKLLRVMFCLATEEKMYDPAKFFGPAREEQLGTVA